MHRGEGAVRYVAEAVRLQQSARTDPKLLVAHRLLEWMRERGPEVGFRELVQYGPKETRTKAAADSALATLIEHGWVVCTSERPRRFLAKSED